MDLGLSMVLSYAYRTPKQQCTPIKIFSTQKDMNFSGNSMMVWLLVFTFWTLTSVCEQLVFCTNPHTIKNII